MQGKPVLMACGQHVPAAREIIHMHTNYYNTTYAITAILIITVGSDWFPREDIENGMYRLSQN